MAEHHQRMLSTNFKSVHLLKDQLLGIGSYGKVCKAVCDSLICAAKLIHETLFVSMTQLTTREHMHRLPVKRFEQECEFLSTIRHPNIVLYLGMCQDPDTGLPVLLMELMDDSLTHFLESSVQPVPYHLQVNICHDITLALTFLHSREVIHRDLSSNNVLLIGNAARAKVADFGMVKLGCLNSQATFTVCPGTDVYMPPEAVEDKSMYTEKMDCFSFGVIALQILTQEFPEPGNRRRVIESDFLGFPSGVLELRVPEIDRKRNQIETVDTDHPILLVALDCLCDGDIDRPSAQQLCQRFSDLKETIKYNESLIAALDRSTLPPDRGERDSELQQHAETQPERQIEHFQQIIQSQAVCLQEKDETIAVKEEILTTERQEKQRLREQLHNIMIQSREECLRLEREKDQAIEEKDRHLKERDECLEANQQVIADFERSFHDLEQQLRQRDLEQPRQKAVNKCYSETKLRLRWNEGKYSAPCKMSRRNDAVASGDASYFIFENHIYAYSGEKWLHFPDCPYEGSSIAVVNDLVTTIGGYQGSNVTNQLFSLTGEGSNRRWSEEFPPMPTKRDFTNSLCNGAALIVTGGMSEELTSLRTVEVMNTETHQWSSLADLPESLYLISATFCGDGVYILGGWKTYRNPNKAVYTCSLSALLLSSFRSRLLENYPKSLRSESDGDKATIWSRVADLPVTLSTCVSLQGHLLAVGGCRDSDKKITTAIHMYDPTTNTWKVASNMATTRWKCFAVVCPDNQLMIVGGKTSTQLTDETDSVEFATAY